MDYTLRLATLGDVPLLHALIERSIRGLGAADYPREQIDAALEGAFGVDTNLIHDGTYFVAETPDGAIVWIYRDHRYGTDDGEWFVHGLFA